MKKLLKANQAAEFLGISRSKLYKLTMNRAIPHQKLFGRLFFEENKLKEWRDEKIIEVKTFDQLEREAISMKERKK